MFLKTSGFAAPTTMLKRFSIVFLAVLSVLLVSCQLSQFHVDLWKSGEIPAFNL
jgi:hypothetical protein